MDKQYFELPKVQKAVQKSLEENIDEMYNGDMTLRVGNYVDTFSWRNGEAKIPLDKKTDSEQKTVRVAVFGVRVVLLDVKDMPNDYL